MGSAVVKLLLLVALYGPTGSVCMNVVHPWRAAEAVVEALSPEVQLRNVDPHSLEVPSLHNDLHLDRTSPSFQVVCGRRMKFELEVNGASFDVVVGDDTFWKKQLVPEQRGAEWKEGVEVRLDEECVLPPVKLAGPLEMKWLKGSQVHLLMPPEASSVANIERLIVADGATIELDGLTELSLQEPVSLSGLQSEQRQRDENGAKSMKHGGLGLMRMSQALHRDAAGGRLFRLEASSMSHGISVHQFPETPVVAAETSSGTLRLTPATSVHCTALPGVERGLWLWPFLDASASDVAPYESLLQQLLQQQQQKERQSLGTAAHLILKTAKAQAVTLLRLLMEVRLANGFTEMLEARVLIDASRYVAVDAQLLSSTPRTITVSHHDILAQNSTRDPFIPLYDMNV